MIYHYKNVSKFRWPKWDARTLKPTPKARSRRSRDSEVNDVKTFDAKSLCVGQAATNSNYVFIVS